MKNFSDTDRPWTVLSHDVSVAIRAPEPLLKPAFETVIMKSMPTSRDNSDLFTLHKVTQTD